MDTQTISFWPSSQLKRGTDATLTADRPKVWTNMEVILKVTERCNINCTYCYFFNMTNRDYESHPPYLNPSTIEEIGRFLANAAKAANVQNLQIDFHGGEPLMMKKERFDAMCVSLYLALADVPMVRLVMQTNAILIDDEWIDIFAKHRIGIGISVDGPKDMHDAYRVDHKGKGTYDDTIDGLRKLQTAVWEGRLGAEGIGLICVIDPDRDAREVFAHFVDVLGMQHLHFLLPMVDHDTVAPDANDKMGRFLCELFDVWVERGERTISIRYMRRLFSLLLGGGAHFDTRENERGSSIAYTIASNGDIGPSDDLRNTFPLLFRTGSNVATSTLDQYTAHRAIQTHGEAISARHSDCVSCCWGKICDGGDLIGNEAFRYSRRTGFANKSVYCESIKELLTHMAVHAVRSGVDFAHIAKVLVNENAPDETSNAMPSMEG